MEFLLVPLLLVLFFTVDAWYRNRQSDKAWNAMHDRYLRQMEQCNVLDGAISGDIKTFYSQRLLGRLNPALHDAGFSHSLIYEITQ